MLWLDLCAGLGGASKPALDRGWRVIRIDIDPRFKPTVVADVRRLPLKPFDIDVLWASPPCQEFSKWGMRCFFPSPQEPNCSIADALKCAIDTYVPRWWFVENVRASRRWLNQRFGPPRVVSTGHVIWTNFPLLLPNIQPHKGGTGYWSPGRWGVMGERRTRHDYGTGAYSRWGKENALAIEAAKIPYAIGEAICIAVERRLGVYKEVRTQIRGELCCI